MAELNALSTEDRVAIDRVFERLSGRTHYEVLAVAPDDRDAIRARALALMTWARSIPTGAGQDVQAQAVATSLAITAQRLARLEVPANSVRRTPRANPARRHAA